MKTFTALILTVTCLFARADLPFKLPPKAKYTASSEAIAKAKESLSVNLVANADRLTNLFVAPMMCGPGLWHMLKDSPPFAKAPAAKSTVKIPGAKGKAQELPMALLQTKEEVASFRMALAELLKSQGKLTIREPNRDEFMKFWAVIPFKTITGALLVVEGKDAAIFCNFEKGRVFWDEVKRTGFKK